ncbi:MAG TPA: metallophosphoesterase [Candidatus Brocadiia bacterium]|nr:metallophosphoesterase [Candidatus Brocadiales bacterium]
MLVFISDIHLTDGTSGETINSGAFEKFILYLKDMADTAGAKEIEVVLLGDIFDVIRSDYWLNSTIRPWSNALEKDGQGKGLEDYTVEIVKSICANTNNKASVQHLKDFKNKMAGVTVNFTYIVGNHDWLINRYPDARVQIANFLGMNNPNQYKNTPFLTQEFWKDYKVFARHGDIYDPFNFEGNRDASSLGDAIVIDLINRFPKAVKDDIGAATDPDLISRLKEIDNVRPLIDVPLWIHGACRRAKTVEIGEKVKDVWNNLVDEFLKIPFVAEHNTWSPADVVDNLRRGLKISKSFPFKVMAKITSWLGSLQPTRDDYRDKAFREVYMKENQAEFALYGHTHGYEIQPLDEVPQKTYFNTGTWRKVHVKAAYDVENQEFLNWHVMTFIAFYLENERLDKVTGAKRRFEVWNGALG